MSVALTSVQEGVQKPKEACYVSFSRTEEDVLDEIHHTYSPDLSDIFKRDVVFEDLSKEYFKSLQTPSEWFPGMGVGKKEKGKSSDMVNKLIKLLNKKPKNSLIILDNLADLARLYTGSSETFRHAILALRQAVKKKDELVYGILSKGVLDRQLEENIVDASDGAFVFKWKEAGTTERSRLMYIAKFRGLLSRMTDSLPVFDVGVNPNTGFTISKVSVVRRVK
jgi:KaiC/GvpD/RAD55 family RecA-like ATPase